MKKGILIILSFLSFSAIAQEDAQFRQFLLNQYYFNPSYAGDDGKTSLTSSVLLGSGNPTVPARSVLLMYQGVVQDQPVGIGFMANYDNNITNDLRRLKVGLAGNYKKELAEESYVRVGAQLNAHYLKDVSPETIDGDTSSIIADIDFGAWYQQQDFFVGASAKNLANSQLNLSSGQVATLVTHLYITAGYKFAFSENFNITPAILLRSVRNLEIVDIHTEMEFFEKGYFGMTVQVSRYLLTFPYAVMGGFKLSDNFRIDGSAHLYKFSPGAGQFLNPIYELSVKFGV